MLKKISVLCIIVLFIPVIIIAQDAKKDEIGSAKFDWPFDRPSGFHNFAQELIFDKEKGKFHLEVAKDYYSKGLKILKLYEQKPDEYDWYNRDPYFIEAISPYGAGMRYDIVTAEYWFAKTLHIVARTVYWDTQINNTEEYRTLVKNTFNNLLFTSIINGHFHKAYAYLKEYRKYPHDANFVDEWESRILGNIVKLHEKYEYAYVGIQSSQYLKKQHRELLIKIIEKRYSGQPELKKEMINRIYPEFVIHSETEKDEVKVKDNTTKEKP